MVSIIVPCYNYWKYLPDCLKSIRENDCGDTQTIVVDDASPEPPSGMDDNVNIIRNHANLGVAGTINVGIRASTGEYIMIVSADDMITPESISCRLELFNAKPSLEVIYGAMIEVHGDMGYDDALKIKPEIHPSRFTVPLYRRSVFQKHGLLHEALRSKEDKEMQYRLGVHKKAYRRSVVDFTRVDKPVYFYRRHEAAQRKRRAKDLMFDITTCMEFDKRSKDVELNGTTKENTEFLI